MLWAGMSNTGRDEIFHTHQDWSWGLPTVLCNGYQVISGVEQPEHGINHSPPSSMRVKEKLEIFLYSRSVLHDTLQGEFYLQLYLYQCKKHKTESLYCVFRTTV